ncbi:MAG TPA: DUF885 domain-containing protein [Planctomycetota bacterium]|nr:DUF885 domain-containing protein [Planctomycetota bacterium]
MLLQRITLFGLPCFLTVGCAALAGRTETESERLDRFFDEAFQTELSEDPVRMSYMGMQDRAGEWTDLSEEFEAQKHFANLRNLERLHRENDFESLDPAARLSYRLFEYQAGLEIEGYRFRDHDYAVNQMHGLHRLATNVLLNVQPMENEAQAEAYIERLQGAAPMLGQIVEILERRERKGVLPPKFVFPLVIQDCRNLLTGAPFEPGAEASPIWADFQDRLAKIEDLEPARRRALLRKAEAALVDSVGPGYRELIATLVRQESLATDDAGVWKLPDGEAYYRYRLRRSTTTNLDADTIHAMGLAEVKRIHSEMARIQAQVGFEGTLNQFFDHLRTDPSFYYSNDETGKAAYLAQATALIDHMREQLPRFFRTLPQAKIEVRAVEPYRERSAGKAFYSSPAPDGSRPGVYYANLYNMADMPRYQMEALAYHEGIPGHHLQIAIAQELVGVPRFRKFGGYTAYSEGWGLYSEWLPKEMGCYRDPMSDFGRLAMELWRACRLVVDTGIHHKRWTREEAIAYLEENTPNPSGDCRKAVERYIVMPGQATAYQIGKLRIMELRAYAETQLGEAFDLRDFHDVVLLSGPVPLDILEERVHEWVALRQAKAKGSLRG